MWRTSVSPCPDDLATVLAQITDAIGHGLEEVTQARVLPAARGQEQHAGVADALDDGKRLRPRQVPAADEQRAIEVRRHEADVALKSCCHVVTPLNAITSRGL